jgi:hypothetical protein
VLLSGALYLRACPPAGGRGWRTHVKVSGRFGALTYFTNRRRGLAYAFGALQTNVASAVLLDGSAEVDAIFRFQLTSGQFLPKPGLL